MTDNKYETSITVNNSDNLCIICQEDINNDVKFLDCIHKFHVNCIDKWLLESNTCPVCRIYINTFNTNNISIPPITVNANNINIPLITVMSNNRRLNYIKKYIIPHIIIVIISILFCILGGIYDNKILMIIGVIIGMINAIRPAVYYLRRNNNCLCNCCGYEC